MIISFKHGGIEYFNYDISDPDTRDYLESQIGRDALEEAVRAEMEKSGEDAAGKLAILENRLGALRDTVDTLILATLEG